jgi:DnaJ-domain-containing protein 1
VTPAEVVVIVVGLIAGYWVISRLLGAMQLRLKPESARDGAEGGAHVHGGGAREIDSQWIRAHWHEVLGVRATATIDQIKAAYRAKITQYHPDRTEGLGPELRSIALRRTQELNIAYTWASQLADRSAGGNQSGSA